MVPLSWYVAVACVMFTIGVIGVLACRRTIVILMAIELMLNAANLLLVALAREFWSAQAQAIVLFVLAVAAAEVAVGLAIIVRVFELKGTLDIDEVNLMKW